ncbi:MAG: hypothetical protein EOO23_05405 [Comamonadaceae bacterium]|nr:MAG: hypothetical protein EOO23_05405 [Comamonadaceae bacterium]
MPQTPKSFVEFVIQCKSEQRSCIHDERARIENARAIWETSVQEFAKLGLHPMDGEAIAARCSELEFATAEVDPLYGDSTTMRASYRHYVNTFVAD